jgi:hypothetical protein
MRFMPPTGPTHVSPPSTLRFDAVDANDVPFLTVGNATIAVEQKWPIGHPFQRIVFSDQDNDVLHYKLALPSPYINISDDGTPSPIVRRWVLAASLSPLLPSFPLLLVLPAPGVRESAVPFFCPGLFRL